MFNNPMKNPPNNSFLKSAAIAVLTAALFCLPFTAPAHAEEGLSRSSEAVPYDTQLVYLLKQSILLLNQGSRTYGGHKGHAIDMLEKALACYKSHQDTPRIRGKRVMTPTSKEYLSQAKSHLEDACARAPKNSEPQKLIENAIRQIDECLTYHGTD
jgi:hypothetical protein